MAGIAAWALASQLGLAVVTQDQSALRAAPRDAAPRQAVLWQGDLLEVRGRKGDYLQVYEHRRERAGYVRASQARRVSETAADAPELLALLRFLRDVPGAETLGMRYVQSYLKAAPVRTVDAEPYEALGAMAERLARRAAERGGQGGDALAGQLEVAAGLGVVLRSVDLGSRVQLCYDGAAYLRALTLPGAPDQHARAALGLTRPDCIDPALRPGERTALDSWRARMLDQVDALALEAPWRNRLHLRRAAVWASVAFGQARRSLPAEQAAQRAVQELAAVDAASLGEDDALAYGEAGIRVAAIRWGVTTPPAIAPATPPGVQLVIRPGQAGENCAVLVERTRPAAALVQRCAYGVMWSASVAIRADGAAAALAVQPLDGWQELWLFQRRAGAWVVDVVPPASTGPELGYIEFAGWIPGSAAMLVARETILEGRYRRRFEQLAFETLAPTQGAERPEQLLAFRRWQDPGWAAHTVSQR